MAGERQPRLPVTAGARQPYDHTNIVGPRCHRPGAQPLALVTSRSPQHIVGRPRRKVLENVPPTRSRPAAGTSERLALRRYSPMR